MTRGQAHRESVNEILEDVLTAVEDVRTDEMFQDVKDSPELRLAVVNSKLHRLQEDLKDLIKFIDGAK
jgi:hypothetical protein